jgi:hypothetical protein
MPLDLDRLRAVKDELLAEIDRLQDEEQQLNIRLMLAGNMKASLKRAGYEIERFLAIADAKDRKTGNDFQPEES